MDPGILLRVRHLRSDLGRRVLGQESALDLVAEHGEHWLGGLSDLAPRFLFPGPTGVGKTETALALAEALGRREPVRLDMSEHQLQTSVETLLGDRHGDPGLLRQKLAGTEGGLLLLDEVEKAHPRILDLLLQMLEPGHVTTADGFQIDLRTTTLVCTTNLATGAVTDSIRLSPAVLEKHVQEQLRRELRPEMLNRLDAIVFFQPLSLEAQMEVLQLHLKKFLKAHADKRGLQLKSSREVEDWLMLRGFDAAWGARPLQRAIRFHVNLAINTALKQGGSGSGQLVVQKAPPRLNLISA